jgi:hypothetical protein
LQVGGLQDHRLRDGSAPAHRADAGQQNFERERFREVIIGAEVEAGDDILVGIAGCEHQDRGAVMRLAKAARDRKTVDPR